MGWEGGWSWVLIQDVGYEMRKMYEILYVLQSLALSQYILKGIKSIFMWDWG